ncbi:MAG: hypothetical protein ISR53_07220, partial [Rhodospirillales bacterium]|nr:hypothetical protein [Rhodospirillales bacterium]
MTINIFVSGLGAFAAAVAAYFWLKASWVDVPDNIDTFIAALKLASKLNAFGAMAAVVAALCGMVLFALQF